MKTRNLFREGEFTGTPEQARTLYLTVAHKLDDAQQYVLLRHLGLTISKELEKDWHFMDDHSFHRALKNVRSKLPEEFDDPEDH